LFVTVPQATPLHAATLFGVQQELPTHTSPDDEQLVVPLAPHATV
jgi:hypothetical protein